METKNLYLFECERCGETIEATISETDRVGLGAMLHRKPTLEDFRGDHRLCEDCQDAELAPDERESIEDLRRVAKDWMP